MKITGRVRIALMSLLLIASIALLVTQKPNSKTESNDGGSVLAAAGENKQIKKIVSWIKKVTPTPTMTPMPTGSTTANSDSASSPTAAPGQSAQASPTPLATTPTPTVSTGLKPTLTPTPTMITAAPTATPTPTAAPTQNAKTSISLYLTPLGNYTPEARANLNLEVTKNANGYWDFLLTGEITKLMPSRNYQVWLCGANCSSSTEAHFTTDENGNKTLSNAKITGHNQNGDPLNRIAIYEILEAGEIPNDPTACFMVANNATPCLARELYL